MKKLLILILISPLFAKAQLISFVYNGDTLKARNPSTGVTSNIITSSPSTFSIGTVASTSQLTVANFATGFPTPQAGTMLHLVSDASTNGRVSFDTYNNASITGYIYQGRRGRGTAASPTAAITDDVLVAMGGDGYGDNSFTGSSVGGISVRANGTFTNSSKPTYLYFTTTPSGSTTQAERLRIQPTGQLKIATYGSGTFTGTPTYTLQVDASGNIIEGSLGGGATWGSITGVLASQTDLANALALKADLISPVLVTPLLGTPVSGNFSTGTFTWPTFNQNTTGSAATLTTPRTINGTSFNGSANITLGNGSVTLAQMADMATASILGRNTAGTGVPEVLSASTTKSLLSLNNVENTALSTWAGTSNVTTLGTIGTGTWQGGVVGSTYGGTGVNNAGRTLTINTNSGTIAFGAASKTLTVNNTLALSGTDASTLNIGAGGTLGSNAFTSTAYVPTSTTVAGFALSSNVSLAALTATNSTLTFSGSYDGSTATTVGLNLGQANTWTAAQTNEAAAPQMILGKNVTTLGSIKMFGNTSGDVTLQPTAAAGTATVQTLPATTGTLVNRVTTGNGVSASNSNGALSFTLGAITPTTVNGNTLTTGTYTITGASAKTLTFNNSLTLAGTDATTMTFPSTSATVAQLNGAGTLTAATSAIANTETKILSSDAAMAANRLVAGTAFEVTLHGTCTSTAAGAGTIRVRYGTNGTTADGVMQAFTLAAAPTSGTNIPFTIKLIVTVRTTGSSATSDGGLTLVNSGTTGLSATATQVVRGTATNINTTTASTFFTVTYISGNASTACTFQDAVITILNK